ncbi:MAG: NAD(P)/FAD-dependent oxidoreductase [Luminiphilus sp.]|nr:NAD(P)/FAD-dependent oxidoreductase [Luminiphilus sp.]
MKKITRRNFINGSTVALGATAFPSTLFSAAEGKKEVYPPALTGMRGNHQGANTYAHARAWSSDFSAGELIDTKESYDLVVVGGGLSGLAAAYFYRQRYGSEKKILILDNHDDFGGHAKRNEHTIDGRRLISYGGSQTLVEPRHAAPAIKALFEGIGVDLNRFDTAFDLSFYSDHGLGATTYFSADQFGRDAVVRHPFCNYYNYIEGLPGAAISDEEAVAQTPLTERGQRQLLQVLKGGLHSLGIPADEIPAYIETNNYFDYLKKTLGVDDPQVLHMARHSGIDWSSASTELLTIEQAKTCGALGFAPVPVYDENNPYIHHFPDGNAGVARALVKYLVPSVAEGATAESLVNARFDYGQLDRPNHTARIRLNSTVVDVHHADNRSDSDRVLVQYIAGGQAYKISASNVVMACYNTMIPHIVSDLPDDQAGALRQQMKSPLIYTSVGLRNWHAFKEQGIGLAMSPGNMHQTVFMDFPVSLGGYRYTSGPNEPCVIQMISCPYSEEPGKPRADQYREARYRMLDTPFSAYEEAVRNHLDGMLSAEYFNFDRDVASLTVNRWAHGYTVPGPGDSVAVGRKPHGRITIANSDSAPEADAIAAMEMGYRAVTEL